MHDIAKKSSLKGVDHLRKIATAVGDKTHCKPCYEGSGIEMEIEYLWTIQRNLQNIRNIWTHIISLSKNAKLHLWEAKTGKF